MLAVVTGLSRFALGSSEGPMGRFFSTLVDTSNGTSFFVFVQVGASNVLLVVAIVADLDVDEALLALHWVSNSRNISRNSGMGCAFGRRR
jgi:hypothetical protein